MFSTVQELKDKDQVEKALEIAMEIIKIDKNWDDKKVNKYVLSIFKELGNNSPLVQKYRKIMQRLLSWFIYLCNYLSFSASNFGFFIFKLIFGIFKRE